MADILPCNYRAFISSKIHTSHKSLRFFLAGVSFPTAKTGDLCAIYQYNGIVKFRKRDKIYGAFCICWPVACPSGLIACNGYVNFSRKRDEYKLKFMELGIQPRLH